MKNRGEIRSLTGLRGVAACFVMIYHYYSGVLNKGHAGILLAHGYMAVDMFFVLSGFVMAFTYRAEFLKGFAARSYLGFLYKRLSRVFPLYLVALLATTVLAYLGANHLVMPSNWMFLTNALMIQSMVGVDSIVGPTWSISTEFFAYLIFPLLVIMALGGGSLRNAIAGVLSVSLLVFVATRSDLAVGNTGRKGALDIYAGATIYPMLRCLAEFTLGLLAYRATQVAGIMRVAEWRFTADLLMIAIVGLMMTRGVDVAISLLFVPLIVVLAAETSVTAHVLSRPMIYWLGAVSYSIYLMHRVVENALEDPFEHALTRLHVNHAYSIAHLPIMILVIGVSALTYYWIEKPARDWLKKAASRKRQDLPGDFSVSGG